jgi:replicative DNA helicase
MIYKVIFQAIQSLYTAGDPIDCDRSSELKEQGTFERSGGDFKLITLTQKNNIIGPH